MSRSNDIKNYINSKINWLISNCETSSGKSLFSTLRRGIGKKPGDLPELWGVLLLDMPESFVGKTTAPSKEEWACYTALTLYALHQQGNDPATQPMHKKGDTLGKAMNQFSKCFNDENATDRILTKLRILSSSKSNQEIAYHFRTIIELLRSKNIALDYGELACDLFLLQSSEYSPSIRLKWGREFYSNNHKEDIQKSEENKNG